MEPQSSQLAHPLRSDETPLHVLFDGRKLGDGGIGVYIDSSIRGLLHHGGVRLTVVGSREQADRVAWRGEVEWIYDATKPYSLSEYALLAKKLECARFDLFHAPHYTLPFGISIPSVVTVHDLIHIEHPQHFYYPFIARRLVRSAVQRASAIIAVSKDTKAALVRHISGAEGKVVVIPNSIPDLEGPIAHNLDQVLQLRETSPYFVAVLSNLKPHKGVADLITAYKSLVDTLISAGNPQQAPRLVLVGYGAEKLALDRVLSKQVSSHSGIRVVGAVSSAVLKALYADALGVVIPSLAEGFCLPALEAQSVGARVICRPVPALRELITERDLVAQDYSREALEAVMRQAALQPPLDRSINRTHLENYSQQRIAERLISVYQGVLPQLKGVRVA